MNKHYALLLAGLCAMSVIAITVGLTIALQSDTVVKLLSLVENEVPWQAPATSVPIEIKTIVVKLELYPTDPVLDFMVIHLDGSYTLHYDPAVCWDHDAHLYGPYHSSRHCAILEPDVSQRLINDQTWLNSRVAPFLQYLACVPGWVYRVDSADPAAEEVWFMEMLGVEIFRCS